MASAPQGYVKKQSQLARQNINGTALLQTAQLTSSNTSEIIDLGMVAQKLTITTTNGLAATASYSIDGVNFTTPGAISSTPVSYSTNLVKVIKITWTSGSGTAVVAAV